MKRTIALLLTLCSPAVMALGLGPLNSASKLNEPFRGRIALIEATANELDSLRVALADRNRFREAGIERPLVLGELKFRLVRPEIGRAYIEVSSAAPMREPFLNLLLEVNWATGRLLREYTVLLDPPIFDPTLSRDSIAAAAPGGGKIGGTPVDLEHEVVANVPNFRGAATGTAAPTISGDTLWAIAEQARPDGGVTVQQAMVALLRENPEAFFLDNVNALKRGVILRVPDRAAMDAVSAADAVRLVQEQAGLWEAYRQGRSRAAPVAPAPTAPGAEISDSGAAVEDSARPELRVVPPADGSAGVDTSAGMTSVDGADADGLRNEIARLNEELITREQELADLKERMLADEEIISAKDRLIELKDEQLAELQQQLAAVADGEMSAMEDPESPPSVDEEPAPSVDAEITDSVTLQPEPEEMAEEAPAVEPEMPAEEPAVVDEPVAPPPPAPGLLGAVNDLVATVVPRSILQSVPGGGLTVAGVPLLLALAGLGVALGRGGSKAPKAKKEPKEKKKKEKKAKPEKEKAAKGKRSLFGGKGADAEAEAQPAADPASDDGQGSEAVTEIPDAEDESPAAEDQDSGDATVFAMPDGMEAPAAEPSGDEDLLMEFNQVVAYEQFDRAEEIARDLIAKNPDSQADYVRLLEVFYYSSDKAKYEDGARTLHEMCGGEGENWAMAVSMWEAMSPDRALFAEGGGATEPAPTEADDSFLDLTAVGEEEDLADTMAALPGDAVDAVSAAGVDVDLEGEEDDLLDLTATAEAQPQDEDMLDLTAMQDAETLPSEVENVDAVFDPTGELAETLTDETSADEDVTLLDVTSGDEEPLDVSEPDDSAQSAPAEAEEEVFDLTVSEDSPPEAFPEGDDLLDVTQTGDISSLGDDLLNVTAPGLAAETPVEGDAPEEVALGDTALDLELGDAETADVEAAVEAGGSDEVLDLTLSDLAEEGDSGEGLEITLGDSGGDDQALDITLGESEKADQGLDIGLEGPTDVAAEEGLDITLGDSTEPEADDALGITLEDSSEKPAEDDEVLDITLGDTDAADESSDEEGVFNESETIDQDSLNTALEDEGSTEAFDLNLITDDAASDEAVEAEPEPVVGEDTTELVLDDMPLIEESSADADVSIDLAEPVSDGETSLDDDVLDISLGGSDLDEVLSDHSEHLLTEEEANDLDSAGDSEVPEIELDITGGEALDSGEHLDTLKMEQEEPPEPDDGTFVIPRASDIDVQSLSDEVDTKLDLAKAYIDMGNTDGAREILDEVTAEGTEQQREEAARLLEQLS